LNSAPILVGSILAITAMAQQGSDKPSPVPRKPVRPPFAGSIPEPGKQRRNRNPGAKKNDADRETDPERARTPAGTMPENGIACFFSSSANGALTASGIRLNSEELVAAHPWFPLGGWLRAKNLANGETVDVRIVDRFPETSGRVINLSEAAARKLGFVRAGTTMVELEPVDGGAPANHK
jgi:rare lipoprotein A